MNTLGERLNYARKKKWLYTRFPCQINWGVIFNLEKNKTEPQTIVTNAICKTLKINKEWLINGVGEIESVSESSKNAKVLDELYKVAKELSEDEQLYLLDTVKALKQRLKREQK